MYGGKGRISLMGHRKLFHGIIVSFITSIIMYFLSCYSIIQNSKTEIIIITARKFWYINHSIEKFIVNSSIVNPYYNLFRVRTIRIRIIYLHMYIKLNFHVFQSLYVYTDILLCKQLNITKHLGLSKQTCQEKNVNNKRHLPRAIPECICIESCMHKVKRLR